jgi:Leucine-rich repeat (LRR) protein
MPGLIELLSFVSLDNGTALQMQSTPQNNALKWLANNTNLGNYPDKRKIQRYALAVFYYSTNGDNWSNNTGWLNNENECDWYIQPNNNTLCASGDVVNLDFIDEDTRTDNNLDGTLPNELALLSGSLRRLDLGRNDINGSISTEIGLMGTLRTLWLYSNSLTGQIPSEIGKFTALTTLQLRENSLTGSLPSEVGSMASLTRLTLWTNSLTGPIPSEIKSLTSLTSLSLSDNNFTGEFVCPTFIDVCHISCIPDLNDTVMEEACRSL